MANAPSAFTSKLRANQTTCMDCGETHGPFCVECPDCGSRALEPEHASDHPLGFDDDDDWHIAAGRWGPERWVYYAKETP